MHRAAVVVVFLFISSVTHADTTPDFTASEKQWIREHPVVRYAIDPYWPMEYVENGEHKGLTRDYIDHISRVSGLRFQRVESASWSNTLDMIAKDELDVSSAVSRFLLSPAIKQKLLLSDVFFVGASIVVTRSGEPILFSVQKLNGKTVAVKGGGAYELYLRKHLSHINLLLIEDPEQALYALVDGSVDAVVGLDVVLQPIITRKFLGTLHLAGVLAEMPVINVMGINPRSPELLSIINKSLHSITSELSDSMVDRWIGKTNYGAPSWGAIVRYYSLELIFALIGVVAIGVFASLARSAQRRAQQSEAAKTAFMSMMSHEIRTPMNGVLSSIELLQSFDMTLPQLELTTLANVSARNLLEMLDDVLDISKLEAKGISIECLPTDLEELARGLADIHRLGTISRDTTLKLDIDGLDDILPLIDPTRIRQVISNLLSNAVKFTRNGEIVLYLRFHVSGPDNGTLRVEVRDTGIGIEQEQQSRLFKAFVQADNSITRRYGGTGLGLSICKQLVQLMGGRIQLNSALGLGTRIGFDLNLNFEIKPPDWHLPAHPEQQALKTSAVTQQQVLVVEDHPINQRTIGLQLQELGYRALIVADGVAALSTLTRHDQRNDIAIVLLDCHLPDMDGYEVAKRIRLHEKDYALTHLPIIAISASTNEAHQRKCLESGIDGQLSKPLDLAGLQRLFELWLPAESAAVPVTHTATTAPANTEMLDLFLETSHEDIAFLRDALERNDGVRALHYAHRLHGSALTMKDSHLVTLAKNLENSLRDPSAPDEHCGRFLKTVDSLSVHLTKVTQAGKT